jgi:hypothetical protein
VELDNVTFEGGGNLVYWDRVENFRISDNKVVSITAANPATNTVQNGYYLVNCSGSRGPPNGKQLCISDRAGGYTRDPFAKSFA